MAAKFAILTFCSYKKDLAVPGGNSDASVFWKKKAEVPQACNYKLEAWRNDIYWVGDIKTKVTKENSFCTSTVFHFRCKLKANLLFLNNTPTPGQV